MFKILGPDGYNNILQHPDWKFTKDQWEPEMWGKPYRKVGMDGLIYCSPQIPEENFDIIPGPNGYQFVQSGEQFATDWYGGCHGFGDILDRRPHHIHVVGTSVRDDAVSTPDKLQLA